MSFVSLNTALSGIRAARVGMDTTAHNIANAGTPGYTRQRVDLRTSPAYRSPSGQVGTGVTVADIARVRDSFLDARVRGDLAASGTLDVRADLLTRAEGVLGEPDDGLTEELTGLWSAFEDLALAPEDRAARRQVVSALGSVAARVRAVDGGLDVLRQDTAKTLSLTVSQANGLFDRVAELNRTILDASSGAGTPNDLMDERDGLIDELSRTVGATATLEPNGTVRMSVSGLAVVSGTASRHLSVDPTTAVVTHDTAGVAVTPGGEAAGLQRFLTEDLVVLRGQLASFVDDLRTTVNGQHAAGFDANGDPGGDLFVGATPLTFAAALDDPDLLAAAGSRTWDAAASTYVVGPQDAENATALADLRTSSKLDTSLRTFVTEHAADVAATQRAARGQRQLATASGIAREGMHGVSIDEEMVAMLSQQRALEASSRMMSAVDQALDTIINRTGLVGR